MFQRRPRRQENYGIYLLFHHLISSGRIPPVTLWTILFQTAVFLGVIPNLGLDRTRNLCLLPSRIIYSGEWIRLLASVILHGDDMHLYYNMASFLWKGRKLENYFGSLRFIIILGIFSISSTLITVGLSILLDKFLDYGYMNQCAVGFSGVLFALKVLVNTYFADDNQMLFGWFPIPSKYACWAELLLIQFLSPNVSFVGHLAGIIAGVLYVLGPLKVIIDAICVVLEARHSNNQPSAPTESDSEMDDHLNNRGGVFRGRNTTERNYEAYTGGLSEEEQLRRATEESLRNTYQRRHYGWRI